MEKNKPTFFGNLDLAMKARKEKDFVVRIVYGYDTVGYCVTECPFVSLRLEFMSRPEIYGPRETTDSEMWGV